MEPGIILNKWNLVQDELVVAQCFATTLYEAYTCFENANLEVEISEIKLAIELNCDI